MDILKYKLYFRTFCGFGAGHHRHIYENGSDTSKMPSTMERKLGTINHEITSLLQRLSAPSEHPGTGVSASTAVCTGHHSQLLLMHPRPGCPSRPHCQRVETLPGLKPRQGSFAPCLPAPRPRPFPPAHMPHQK